METGVNDGTTNGSTDEAWVNEEPTWWHQVRRCDPAQRRPVREAAVMLAALARVTRDAGETRYVFEALGNFPAFDLLRRAARDLPLYADPRFRALHAQRKSPRLDARTVLAWKALPAGTLGHEYARFVAHYRLHNLIPSWDHLDLADPGEYMIHLTVLLHDLIHFIGGFPPFETIGEMEVEAFLWAQNGAPNHPLFLAGYVANLARNDPGFLARTAVARKIFAAYRFGQRAERLLLVDWEPLFARPLAEVRRELRLDERPPWRASDVPHETPKLAHVVLNVPDLARAEAFYTGVFGYAVAGRDDRLGVVFLTAGNDHHTIALQELPTGVRGAARGVLRAARLLRSRVSGPRSQTGRRTVLPPLAIMRAALRPGLNHVGYRAANMAELRAYHRRLTASGVKIEWAVNHADLVQGCYFRDPAGNFCEIFVDTVPLETLKEGLERGTEIDVPNYELDLERDLAAPGEAALGA